MSLDEAGPWGLAFFGVSCLGHSPRSSGGRVLIYG